MSVPNKTCAAADTTVPDRPVAEGVYASLFDKNQPQPGQHSERAQCLDFVGQYRAHNDSNHEDVVRALIERESAFALKSAGFRRYGISDAGQEMEYFNTRPENVKGMMVNPGMHGIRGPSKEEYNPTEQTALRHPKITWISKDGNIIHSDSWNERVIA